MTALTGRVHVEVINDADVTIPPFSVVICTSVTATDDAGQDVRFLHHVNQYDGVTGGNVMVTGMAPIPAGRTGRAFFDQFLFVAINPDDPDPTPGEEWGPVANQWYLGPSGTGFFAQDYVETGTGSQKKAMFYRSRSDTGSASSGGGGGGGCTDCDCTNCITVPEAVIGGCANCPDGAAELWSATMIDSWPQHPNFAGNIWFYYGIQNWLCTSSSSMASSAGDGCTWTSCKLRAWGSSGSSSSTFGDYRFELNIGATASATGVSLLLANGDEVLGL